MYELKKHLLDIHYQSKIIHCFLKMEKYFFQAKISNFYKLIENIFSQNPKAMYQTPLVLSLRLAEDLVVCLGLLFES